ncbi:MAG: hypothetical protein R2766_02710 [Saprospiraceae bacterium]
MADANWTETGGDCPDLKPAPITFMASGDGSSSISFTIDADYMGTSITNNAEDSADDDTDPNITAVDIRQYTRHRRWQCTGTR